ncbi:hypothetical protein PR048_011402 [Dryococelus australis]|uniref:Uncharacterized protein n=1 Tax=Dryococelus australis TaxID=614101 RepID=A0ABQ9HLH4_9NEOP|nr:hypothetical protein PR048_011402 [Dryococelus australis]
MAWTKHSVEDEILYTGLVIIPRHVASPCQPLAVLEPGYPCLALCLLDPVTGLTLHYNQGKIFIKKLEIFWPIVGYKANTSIAIKEKIFKNPKINIGFKYRQLLEKEVSVGTTVFNFDIKDQFNNLQSDKPDIVIVGFLTNKNNRAEIEIFPKENWNLEIDNYLCFKMFLAFNDFRNSRTKLDSIYRNNELFIRQLHTIMAISVILPGAPDIAGRCCVSRRDEVSSRVVRRRPMLTWTAAPYKSAPRDVTHNWDTASLAVSWVTAGRNSSPPPCGHEVLAAVPSFCGLIAGHVPVLANCTGHWGSPPPMRFVGAVRAGRLAALAVTAAACAAFLLAPSMCNLPVLGSDPHHWLSGGVDHPGSALPPPPPTFAVSYIHDTPSIASSLISSMIIAVVIVSKSLDSMFGKLASGLDALDYISCIERHEEGEDPNELVDRLRYHQAIAHTSHNPTDETLHNKIAKLKKEIARLSISQHENQDQTPQP